MTIQAHRVAALASLCRVFDEYSGGTHLPRLLREIKENLSAFDREQFCERYKDDPWRLTFSSNAQRPVPEQLERDIAFCSSDPAVITLRNWRNNAIAHTNQRITAGTLRLQENDPLRIESIQDLLNAGYEMLNYYSTLFQGMDFGGFLEDDREDYKTVLQALRRGHAADSTPQR